MKIDNMLKEYLKLSEVDDTTYDIEKPDIFLKTRKSQTEANILNQLQFNFKWNSNSEEVIIPRNFEILLRIKGIMGFLINEKKFVMLSPVHLNENNDISDFVAIGLGTDKKSYGEVTLNEVIPCFNNPLGLSDIRDISYFAYEKAQNDVSRMFQLIYSRITPLLKTDNDKVRDQVSKALEDLKDGKPAIILTKLIDELEKLDILDPNNIAKMEYLTSYDEVLDKNIANRFGASLDIKDKKAQVNNAELKAYDDITTMNYLVNYECRLEFVEKMKEAGFDIEVVVSPIFADEPTEEEIEEPELLDEEPEENSGEDIQEENKEENNNEEN
jgi:hypothetical protein